VERMWNGVVSKLRKCSPAARHGEQALGKLSSFLNCLAFFKEFYARRRSQSFSR